MHKKHLLKFGKYTIILFFISFVILIAIAYDMLENEREEYPWFTFWVALVSAIGFIVGCVACAIALKKK